MSYCTVLFCTVLVRVQTLSSSSCRLTITPSATDTLNLALYGHPVAEAHENRGSVRPLEPQFCTDKLLLGHFRCQMGAMTPDMDIVRFYTLLQMVNIPRVPAQFVFQVHSHLPIAQPETVNSNFHEAAFVSCNLPSLASFIDKSILSPEQLRYLTFIQAATQSVVRHTSRQHISHHLLCPPAICANHNTILISPRLQLAWT